MTTTLVDTFVDAVWGEEDTMEVTFPPFHGQELVFVVGPRAGRTVSLDPTRPRGNASSPLARVLLHREGDSPDRDDSEAGFRHVRRMLPRIRTTQQSEAWGASPIENYMELRF